MLAPMVIFQFATTLLSVAVSIYAFSCWHQKQLMYFSALSLAITMNALGYSLEAISANLDGALIACKVAYIGAPFTGLFLYFFSRDYIGKPRIKKLTRYCLISIGIIFTAAIFAYPWLPLFYSDLSFSTEGLLPHLRVTPGILYYPCFIYIAIFTVLALINFCKNFIAEKRYEGAPIFMAGVFFPVIAQTVALSGLIDGWNPTYTALVLSSLMLAWFMARYRQAEWQSMGRDLVVQDMQDAFILVDNSGFVLDFNNSAHEYFPELKLTTRRKQIGEMWDFPMANYKNYGTHTVGFERDGALLNLKVTISPLEADGVVTGSCVIINDDTVNTLMLKELSRLARQDELTGLNNRATFFHDATYSFDLARRQGDEFGCALMMDIDLFKYVNDNYGHSVGDEVLCFIGEMLIKRFRLTDICGRYGGEELCVWMPSTTLAGALQVAEEVRLDFAAKVFEAEQATFNVTISIGIACMRMHKPKDFEDLIKMADFALYDAKHQGRNRVCVYSGTNGDDTQSPA